VLYFGIRVFNILPSAVRDLSYDVKQFKLAVKRFLLHASSIAKTYMSVNTFTILPVSFSP